MGKMLSAGLRESVSTYPPQNREDDRNSGSTVDTISSSAHGLCSDGSVVASKTRMRGAKSRSSAMTTCQELPASRAVT